MKENNLKEILANLSTSMKYLEDAKMQINDAYKIIANAYMEQKGEAKEEPKDNKVKVTIKVQNPFKEELEGLSDEEIEQIRKDLEEIINDFTRE